MDAISNTLRMSEKRIERLVQKDDGTVTTEAFESGPSAAPESDRLF